MVKKIQDQMLDELLTSMEKKDVEEKVLLTERTSNKESEKNV